MKIDNIKVYDLEESIKASGYPMREILDDNDLEDNDIARAKKLSKLGGAHEQYLTGIRVNFDLTCSNKMWVEAERYRFLEFVSSQSTMHRITRFDIKEQCNKYVDSKIINILQQKINAYNYWVEIRKSEVFINKRWYNDNPLGIRNREEYNKHCKELYLEILYNIPSGFELTARLTTNYRCLKNIYNQRKNHRLPEWREFCKEIKELPYFKEICLGESEE